MMVINGEYHHHQVNLAYAEVAAPVQCGRCELRKNILFLFKKTQILNESWTLNYDFRTGDFLLDFFKPAILWPSFQLICSVFGTQSFRKHCAYCMSNLRIWCHCLLFDVQTTKDKKRAKEALKPPLLSQKIIRVCGLVGCTIVDWKMTSLSILYFWSFCEAYTAWRRHGRFVIRFSL